jgi:hypothetical protein
MTQYIDKDALVAMIKHHIKEETHSYFCKCLLSEIDTLEVKEVDLEKEFDNYANGILACDIQFEPFTHLHNCAKYFFELGLKTKSK